MAKVTRMQAEEQLKELADNVTENDLKKVLEAREQIEDKFKRDGPLGGFIADLTLLFSIV